MPVARPEPQELRVIAHVDLDCFYVQVEQRKMPELRGKPAAVVQYNSWKGGGLIAVGYEAREFGVKRSMRGDEAKKVCPDIQLIQVPVARGKADLNLYRDAGSEVVSVLARKGKCERASIDEVYLDITDAAKRLLLERPLESIDKIPDEALKTHILGLAEDAEDRKETVRSWLCRNDGDDKDHMLACGAIIVAELRMEVLSETQFTCSAGIAHNKMLAKLASGMHKPAQQTIVPASCVPELLASLPVKKMKQLGGKLGSSLENDLGIKTVGELLQFSESKLQELYGVNTGTWLWNIARGISGDEVKGRLLPKSQGCGKTFPGPRALRTIASVEHWLGELSAELNDRIQADLEQNKRIAHHLTLHVRAYQKQGIDSNKKFPSKSCPLRYGKDKILQDALHLFERGLWDFCGGYAAGKRDSKHGSTWAVVGLSVTASNIFSTPGVNPITQFFQGATHVNVSSVDLSSFAEDANHDESTKDLCSLKEEYMDDITENNIGDIQSETLEMENTNGDNISDCSCTETGDTNNSFIGEFSSNKTPGVTLNQTDDKLVLNQNLQLLSYWNGSRHGNNLNQTANDGSSCSETTVRQNEEASLVDKGSSTQRESYESFAEGHEQQPVIRKKSHPETKVDKKVGSLKLEDIWKKHGGCSSAVSIPQKSKANNWYYKPEEIDESILTELPEEIQQELRSSFGFKRTRMDRHSTIGDYFKGGSNVRKT